MIPLRCARLIVPCRLRVLSALALVVVVTVCAAPNTADAAFRSRPRERKGSSDVVLITPVPLFDESEVTALVAKPSVSFTAKPARIPKGGKATLSWRVKNADSITISNVGNVSSSSSKIVAPAAKTSYTLTARNRNGTTTQTVTVDIVQLGIITGVEIIKPVKPIKPIIGVIMLENLAYDLVAKANTATWQGSARLIYGRYGGGAGFARTLTSAKAEDNKNYNNCIHMGTSQRAYGFVYGRYTVPIPPNGRFVSTVGFGHGVGSPDGATAFVLVRGPGEQNYRTVANQHIARDGKLNPITADLKQYANKTVTLQLQINAGKQFQSDMVLWVAPRILK